MPEAAIFRRFASLNIQNLLYYQAELTTLEKELRDFELGGCHQFPTHSPDKLPAPTGRYATDWEWLGLRQPENPQWQCMLKIRSLLEKYSSSLLPSPLQGDCRDKQLTIFHLGPDAAIIQQLQMSAIPDPKPQDLRSLRAFLQSQIDHCPQEALVGSDADTWGDPSLPNQRGIDLLVLRPRPAEDMFTNFFADTCMRYIYQKIWCPFMLACFHKKCEVAIIRDTTLLRFTSLCTTAMASLLPVASIAVLYAVHAMTSRLFLVAGFTLLFSVAVSILTTATKSEVFAATAA